MIFGKCKFDPERDIQQVDQFGYIDLREVFAEGQVNGTLSYNDLSFNEIEDLASIVGKPSDVFEAMRYGVSLNAAAAASEASSSEKEGGD